MAKIGIGIVLHYPDIQKLKNNISLFPKNNILLINNTPNDTFHISNVCMINNKENLGVAKAYNQILSFFEKKGFDWVITFDQDSQAPANMLSEYEKAISVSPELGAICPNLQYQDGSILHEQSEKKFVTTCISSGCMISINAWKAVGGFDDRFFIDFVDFDFCYSLLEKGYKILELTNVIMKHQLGNLTPRYLFGRKIMVTHHSPVRKFYFVRNSILCHMKHKSMYSFFSMIRDIFNLYVKTILFEKEKVKKIIEMNRGLYVGLHKNG